MQLPRVSSRGRRYQQAITAVGAPAKGAAVCPEMNGALERAVLTDLAKLDVTKLGKACEQSYILEHLIKDFAADGTDRAGDRGGRPPGGSVVDKRATP